MSQHPLILALDQGTTSSRAILFDRDLQCVAISQQEFSQIYPRPGWVEHDPDVLWESQRAVMQNVLKQAGRRPTDIAALAIANQRETVLVWERETGKPIYNAIVWQCRRTAEVCDKLKRDGAEPFVCEKTGLVLDAYFSASKIAWVLDHVVGARSAAERGDLLCGTIDTWLIWKLSGGAAHVTDFTNASRTQLFNIHTLCWDEELLALFKIPAAMLPTVVPSSGIAARACFSGSDGCEVPIMGIAGDQQAALFGQGCFNVGDMKNTYGTGCFLLMNSGEQPVVSQQGLLTTLTAQTRSGAPFYALEGSVFMGGAVMQWLRDEVQILERSSDAGVIAATVPDTGGVYLVPAFAGLGAPHWDMYARGSLVGMTRGTGRRQIIRAAEEAIAYQCYDLVAAIQSDAGYPITSIRVDGGAASDDFLMQFQADILNCEIDRPACQESTALGVAALAALALGWQTQASLAGRLTEKKFYPSMAETQRKRLLKGWQKAVGRAAEWEEREFEEAANK